MGKRATTIEEQIQKLKDRGMNLDLGEDKAKEVLLDIGFYRLGFYWHPFERDEKHNFKADTKFSDVIELYYLDVDLRNLLQKYLNRVEVNFRTKIIYLISNIYQSNPIWFIDPKIVKQTFINDFDKKIYTPSFKKNNKTIKAHHAKHFNDRYAPAWKTIEFFTFGTVLTLFNSLKDENVKYKVSKHFGIKSLKVFINHIKTIVRLRNICSHGSLLYDDQLPVGIKTIPGLAIKGNDRKKLIAEVRLLSFYVSKISENRSKDLEKGIDQIMEKHKNSSVLKEIIETKTGYKFV